MRLLYFTPQKGKAQSERVFQKCLNRSLRRVPFRSSAHFFFFSFNSQCLFEVKCKEEGDFNSVNWEQVSDVPVAHQ